jgi:hypothetical protein
MVAARAVQAGRAAGIAQSPKILHFASSAGTKPKRRRQDGPGSAVGPRSARLPSVPGGLARAEAPPKSPFWLAGFRTTPALLERFRNGQPATFGGALAYAIRLALRRSPAPLAAGSAPAAGAGERRIQKGGPLSQSAVRPAERFLDALANDTKDVVELATKEHESRNRQEHDYRKDECVFRETLSFLASWVQEQERPPFTKTARSPRAPAGRTWHRQAIACHRWVDAQVEILSHQPPLWVGLRSYALLPSDGPPPRAPRAPAAGRRRTAEPDAASETGFCCVGAPRCGQIDSRGAPAHGLLLFAGPFGSDRMALPCAHRSVSHGKESLAHAPLRTHARTAPGSCR